MMNVKCKKVKSKEFDPKRAKTLWTILYLTLAVSLIAEFTIPDGKGHFEVEEFPFFNALFGFAACVGIVFLSKFLGFFFKREEKFYDK